MSTPRWKIGDAGAHPALFMASLENVWPLLPFIGSLSSMWMSLPYLERSPATLVLCGREPETDVYLDITAQSLGAEVRQVMATPFQGSSLPGLLHFPGLGTSHTCLCCASQVPGTEPNLCFPL